MNQLQHNISITDCPSNINCKCINRVIQSLNNYSSYKRNKFIEFIETKYTNYLNDIIHFTDAHGPHLPQIYATFVPQQLCDIKKCDITRRHCMRTRNVKTQENDIKDMDVKFIFYQSIFDSVHFFVFHLFETGLRHMTHPHTVEEHKQIEPYFDAKLSKRQQDINRKVSDCNIYHTEYTVHTKFNLQTEMSTAIAEEKSDHKYKYKFETGNRMDYWCKNSQRYVAAKFTSLKEEILKSAGIDTMSTVAIKATAYLNTDYAKNLKSSNSSFLKCYIKNGSRITYEHLIAIILYTDFSELSATFSGTFRSLYKNESEKSIKMRNSEYANWGRLLMETISLYGHCRGHGRKVNSESISGPFYCGVDKVLCVYSFAISLNAPTSTTHSLCMALNFTKGSGMILEFNNVGSRLLQKVKCLSVAWVSTFKAEDEYVFMGGGVSGPLRLQRIFIDDGYTYSMDALFLFDCMVSGVELYQESIRQNNTFNRKLLKKLIKIRLNKNDKHSDQLQYYMDTFHHFCNKKTYLKFNIPYIMLLYGKLRQLVMSDTNDIAISILKIFNNVKTIEIITSDDDGFEFFQVNIQKLMEIIEIDNIQNIEKITIATNIQYQQWLKEYQPSTLSWVILQQETIDETAMLTLQRK